MSVNIDRIYDMLSWDNDLLTQSKGIAEAKKIQSLWVLILPILERDSKSIWENCAKVLCSKSDETLKPYLCQLFNWLKDLNWPGASLIYDRLIEIPYREIETSLAICLLSASESNDHVWENSLTVFRDQKLKKDGIEV